MLINVIRAMFIVVIVAVMFVNINKLGESKPFPKGIDESMQQLIRIGRVIRQPSARQASKDVVDYMSKQSYEKFFHSYRYRSCRGHCRDFDRLAHS